ncbi:MAG: hypothetical protein U0670_21455 [Anaerolineae bacterium]
MMLIEPERRRLLLLAVVFVLFGAGFGGAAVNGQTESADEPAPPSLFVLTSPDPTVPHGRPRDWDGRFSDPGTVIYHGGLFHMFRNGFQLWPGSVQIGYLTSEDGVTWTEQSEDPILRSADVSFAGVAILSSSAVVEDDGTWVLYFYTWDTTAHRLDAGGTIGRATAVDPLGPWTVYPEPILTAGSAGEWDDIQVSKPHVLRTEDGYLMYYSGHNHDQERSIGLAMSDDGIHWTKYDDPATTEAPFAESDPVFIPGEAGTWDAGEVAQPIVDRIGDQYVLLYRGYPMTPPVGPTMNLGIATSADGIHWTRYPENPVLNKDEMPALDFWDTAAVYHEGTEYLYLEFTYRGNSTSTYSLRSVGEYPPAMP